MSEQIDVGVSIHFGKLNQGGNQMKKLAKYCLALILLAGGNQALSAADIVDYKNLDKKPKVVEKAMPVYPEEACRKNQTGITVVNVVVDESGRVSRTKIEKSSGFPLLDEAAVQAALKFRFEPGEKDGKAVKTRMTIPFRFKLDKKTE